jgi:hypothetical protein
VVSGAFATGLGGMTCLVGVNVIIILTVPFCLAGLAVLHTIARRFSRPTVRLLGVYVLTGLFGWPPLVVIFLGLLDRSLGLRRHILLPRSIGGKNDG